MNNGWKALQSSLQWEIDTNICTSRVSSRLMLECCHQLLLCSLRKRGRIGVKPREVSSGLDVLSYSLDLRKSGPRLTPLASNRCILEG